MDNFLKNRYGKGAFALIQEDGDKQRVLCFYGIIQKPEDFIGFSTVIAVVKLKKIKL